MTAVRLFLRPVKPRRIFFDGCYGTTNGRALTIPRNTRRLRARRGQFGDDCSCTLQRLLYAVWVVGNNCQIGLCRLIGCRTALLPITQRTEGNMIAGSKFLLRHAQSAANNFCLRGAFHTLYFSAAQRPCIRISKCSAFDGASRHRTKFFMGFPGDRFPAQVSSPSGIVPIEIWVH